ncbi:MAG: acetate--CoA ligase [Actinomycetes bacterium]
MGTSAVPPAPTGPTAVGLAGRPTADDRKAVWRDARAQLDGLPGGGLNMAYEALDRHAHGPDAGLVALRCLAKDGTVSETTYAELTRLAARFAGVLDGLGVRPGERVYLLTGRVRELYVALLGGLRAGAAVCPLFSAFGPEPIAQRLLLGDARVLVTTAALYEAKVAGIRDRVPGLRFVLVVDPGPDGPPPGTLPLPGLLAAAPEDRPVVPTRPEDMALLHFTSGTTGRPKGAVHVHEAVVAHHLTARLVLGLRPGDVFWCTADPGWVTGTSYGVIAPLACGVTVLVDEAEFDVARWYRTLADHRVTVWYTAPTAIRRLMRAGADVARAHDLSALREVASVGEPLNPEAVLWGREALDRTIRDTWWQTETGAIMVANLPGERVTPGAMGRPVPGIAATVLRVGSDDRAVRVDGHVVEEDRPDVAGELALRAGWPSMFRGYLDEAARYAMAFADGWYLSGDLVRRDAEGRYWFVGRADDVIKPAGHLIGPFEVESVLLEHPAVAEAGVIGRPDPVAGEIVKAFVSLKPGHEPDEALRRELVALGRRRLGSVVAPKEIAFADDLPKTRSGKIMRRLLKAREMGLAEGDLSTLEPSADGAR